MVISYRSESQLVVPGYEMENIILSKVLRQGHSKGIYLEAHVYVGRVYSERVRNWKEWERMKVKSDFLPTRELYATPLLH
jgi:hypothetical protein